MEEHQKNDMDNYKINTNERIRTIPVFASLPAIFGQSLAAVYLSEIAGESINKIKEYDEKEEAEEDKKGNLGEFKISNLITEFINEEKKRKQLR